MKRQDCTDPFLRGYLDAALFTTDPKPGQGDYVESGRADEMFSRIPEPFLWRAKADCARFEEQNATLLAQAGDAWQNGCDLFYSRNGHGCGYFDRGYPDEIGDALQDAARKMGSHDLELSGWFLNEYRCPHCREEWTRPEDSQSADFGYDLCEKCDKEVESENRKRGEHMTPIEEPK